MVYGSNMPRNKAPIPNAPLGRILLGAGAKRVSADAISTFAEIITEYTEDISKQAVLIAKHAGRKTVKAEDIKLAVK